MADFCREHSIEIFGTDYKELAGLSTAENTANALYASAICESCGRVQVDHEGHAVNFLDEPTHHSLPAHHAQYAKENA